MLISFYIYLYPITRRLTLSKLRKWKYRFPNEYKLITRKDHIVNITIILSYILVFIIGFFWLRFSNVNRIIDLKVYYNKLYYIFSNTFILYIILNIILILCLFILYKQILKMILKKAKHHIIMSIIYLSNPKRTFASEFYFNAYWKFSRYVHLKNLSNIEDYIRNIFHKLGLRKYPDPEELKTNVDFRYIEFDNRMIYARFDTKTEKIIFKFFREFLFEHKYKIHYIILSLITLYDLIFNDFVLTNTFRIIPFVFIYDILVKICKFQDHNYDINDGIIYEFLYEPWYEANDIYITFGTTTIDKIDMAKIIEYYVHTGLQDIYNKYGCGYHSNKKPKDYIGKAKNTYDNIQINLNSYRNYRLLIFYIWVIYLFSLNIENTIYIYMLFVLLSIINIFYINKAKNKLNEYQNTVNDETNK